MKDEFNYNELKRKVSSVDRKIQDELNIAGSKHLIGVNNYVGLCYLHYVGDSEIGIRMASFQKENPKMRIGAIAREFDNQSFSHDWHGISFQHDIQLQQGKILNSYQWLAEIGTSNGKAYFQTSNHVDDPIITVFTSHFFDRFAVRTGLVDTVFEAQKHRSEMVYEYMTSKTCFKNDEIFEHEGQVAIGTEKGLCLGTKIKDVVLIKTFISNDMLKGNQPIQADETCQPLFDNFNDMLLPENDMLTIDKMGSIKKKQSIGRNDPCHCNSTKKYKTCCLKPDQQKMRSLSNKILQV